MAANAHPLDDGEVLDDQLEELGLGAESIQLKLVLDKRSTECR